MAHSTFKFVLFFLATTAKVFTASVDAQEFVDTDPTILKKISVEFSTDGNGVFDEEKTVTVNAKIESKFDGPATIEYRWTVADAYFKKISESEIAKFDLAKKGSATEIEKTIKGPRPGFYNFQLQFRQSGENVKWSPVRSFRIGIQPTKLRFPLTRENDFEKFWADSKIELGKVKPEFTLRFVEDQSDAGYLLYEVHMKSLGSVQVGGWLEVPVSEKPVPCLLRVPGYGQNMRPVGKKQTKGLAIFSFNVRGHGNSQRDVPGKPQDFWIRGLDNRDKYYYRGAYMDCVRAMEFLKSRKEIDSTRIAVRGGSQGGGLALVAAALNDNVILCVTDIPFLVDWKNYFKITDWPEMNKWIKDSKGQTWKSTLRTLGYFDLMNFAPKIKCETIMSVGLQDPVCPPTTCFAAYNRIPSKKSFYVYRDAGHWVPREHHELAWKVIRDRLLNPK